jgi:hypothetical protein
VAEKHIQTHKPVTSAAFGDVTCATLTENTVLHLCKRQMAADWMVKDWPQKSSN